MNSNQQIPNEVAERLAQLQALADKLSDDQLWWLMVLCIGVAGERAEKSGELEIEQACVDFVEAMARAHRRKRALKRKTRQ
jgi:hypothetical protein